MTVKHFTASTLLWCRFDDGWRLGLVRHPLLGQLLQPGGHVEPGENAAEAARRELVEETGVEADFLPAPTVPLGPEFPATVVDRPWWICEHPIPYDNRLAQPHVHVDHVYLAVARSAQPVLPGEHPFDWYPPTEWAGLNMPSDVLRQAGASLQLLAEHAAR